MKFSLFVLPALVASAAIPIPLITDAPFPGLAKRGTTEKQLTDKVWTSISSGVTEKVTPTYIDGVTISASPAGSSTQMTVWASLDGSGIPYLVTPTVSDGTTISSSPTPTASDYPTPDSVPPVLRCFGDRIPDSDTQGYPFCTGLNGTEMVVGETYWMTWDPTYFDSTSISKVSISLVAYPQVGNDSDDLFTSDYVSNSEGYYPLSIESDYIRSSSGYFYVVITPLVTSQSTSTNVSPKTGPLIRAIASESDASTTISKVPSDNNLDTASSSSSSSSSSSKSNAKVIAPAVVVPVIAVIAIAAFVVYYLNKQKSKNASTSGSASADDGNGEIHLSRTTTNNASIITEETGINPFKETARTVL